MRQTLSAYVPTVEFRSDSAQLIYDNIIKPRVDQFFSARNIIDYQEIHPSECIGAADFLDYKSFAIDYFYATLFEHVAKSNERARSATFSITFDKSTATERCDLTGIYFSTINIGKHPSFFYILFELQEIFDFLHQNRPQLQFL